MVYETMEPFDEKLRSNYIVEYMFVAGCLVVCCVYHQYLVQKDLCESVIERFMIERSQTQLRDFMMNVVDPVVIGYIDEKTNQLEVMLKNQPAEDLFQSLEEPIFEISNDSQPQFESNMDSFRNSNLRTINSFFTMREAWQHEKVLKMCRNPQSAF